jgi:hypothetical protein
MTKCLTSFPSSAIVPRRGSFGSLGCIARDGGEAKAHPASGGGIDERVPPVLADENSTMVVATQSQTKHLEGGYTVLESPSREAALERTANITATCRFPQDVRAFQFDPASSRDPTSWK